MAGQGKWFAGSLSGEDTSHTVPEVRGGVLGLAGNQCGLK